KAGRASTGTAMPDQPHGHALVSTVLRMASRLCGDTLCQLCARDVKVQEDAAMDRVASMTASTTATARATVASRRRTKRIIGMKPSSHEPRDRRSGNGAQSRPCSRPLHDFCPDGLA